MTRVKYRRWGPYVWWICPSRKCNFENKTDLAFVQGEFLTKCQYCNTPITIKYNSGQLDLQSVGTEEEEAKPASASTPKPSATSLVPQVPANPPAASVVASAPSSPPAVSTTPSPAAAVDNPPEATSTEPMAAKDSESTKKAKESKKKAAS